VNAIVSEWCKVLEGHAARLIQESSAWIPVDMRDAGKLSIQRKLQANLLWQMAVTGGGIIMRLSSLGFLKSHPRLQNRALQIRAELRRHVDSGELPQTTWPSWPSYTSGFDLLVVQLFHECCGELSHQQLSREWIGNEYATATIYAGFMKRLADELRNESSYASS
jgi:hypothetical protein